MPLLPASSKSQFGIPLESRLQRIHHAQSLNQRVGIHVHEAEVELERVRVKDDRRIQSVHSLSAGII